MVIPHSGGSCNSSTAEAGQATEKQKHNVRSYDR